MLAIDLTGKRALVAGVADDAGFGFAIAKALAEAGASVSVGTWPPALNIFMNLLERGKMDASRKLSNGELLRFEKIYPLDASFDTRVLAFEAGRKFGVRVNTISAGPLASRAASAIGIIEKMVEYCAENSPLTDPLQAEEVGTTAAFLSSPLATGITGTVIYVDKGYHSMGMALPEAKAQE